MCNLCSSQSSNFDQIVSSSVISNNDQDSINASENSLINSIDWTSYTAPTEISVGFVSGGYSFDDFYGSKSTVAWYDYEIAASQNAFQAFENVANVSFSFSENDISASNVGEIDFAMVLSNIGALGYWGVGGSAANGDPTLNDVAMPLDGWGVINYNGYGWTQSGLEQGGYGYITLIHEIGHGMGLAHPHDNGGGSSVMNGVSSPFGDFGDQALNQGIYTTMSYNDGWDAPGIGTSSDPNYGFQGTLMALDIAMLQQKYGANTAYRTGNDLYTLPSANQSGTFYQCLWDAGGQDSIQVDGSVTADAVIDLRAATLQYESGGGGFVSYVEGIHGGTTIAYGVVIENARGGSGNDQITGNSANNTLYGFNGNDRIDGGDGGDILYGNDGNDTLNGGNGADTLNGGKDNDILNGGEDNDTLKGAKGDDTVNGEAGNDKLLGGRGDDTLNAGQGNDVVKGSFGADTIIGGGGRDKMFAGIDNDVDTFVFQSSSNSLKGSQRDRILQFDSGEDIIDLSAIDADINKDGNQAFSFSGTSAAANGLWLKDTGRHIRIDCDIDGNKTVDFQILVVRVSSLSLEDFIL